MSRSVIWRGDLDSPSGYSRAARAHIRALIEVGGEVYGEHLKHDRTTVDLDAFWTKHMPALFRQPPAVPRVKVWHSTPEFYAPHPDQYNIAYVVWETSHIPDKPINNRITTDWVAQINQMDEVWTSSNFCKKAFEDSGVVVPIYVFPHPIDINVYQPGDGAILRSNNQVREDAELRMLSVFQWTIRKNPDDLIQFFTHRFGTDAAVQLIIKTYGSDFEDNNHLIEAVRSQRNQMKISDLEPNLHLITEFVPESDIPLLYQSSDVFVSLTRGEGFGLPFQEAMACGIPCVYPRGQAMDDFIDESCGYPFDTDLRPVYGMGHIPWYNGSQLWHQPVFTSVMDAFTKLKEDWLAGKLAEIGSRARDRIVRQHSFRRVGMDMMQRLNEIYAAIS